MRLLVRSTPVVLVCLCAGPAVLEGQAPAPWYERLRFSGDFRVRSESFFQDEAPDRTRLRIRLRAGATAPLGDHFTVGLRVVTAEPGNVTSANVTLGGAFRHKSFDIDRAYVTWAPRDRVALMAGKFALPLWRAPGMLRTEAIFDEEVPPEGLHEEVTVYSRAEGVVRRVALIGDQWLIRESSGGSDSWMIGGQVVVDLALAEGTRLGLSGAYLDFLNGRALAVLRNDNAELLVTNSVVTRSGELLPGGVARAPSTADPFDRFVSAFRLLRATAGLETRGPLGRPLAGWVDWSHNTGATFDPDALWAAVSWGAASRPGEWGIALGYARTEQEAVLSMFSYSDLGRGGTNVEAVVVQATWRPVGALTLQAKNHIASLLRPVAGGNPATLHRLQLDARVSF